jgi:hypothetical protein
MSSMFHTVNGYPVAMHEVSTEFARLVDCRDINLGIFRPNKVHWCSLVDSEQVTGTSRSQGSSFPFVLTAWQGKALNNSNQVQGRRAKSCNPGQQDDHQLKRQAVVEDHGVSFKTKRMWG